MISIPSGPSTDPSNRTSTDSRKSLSDALEHAVDEPLLPLLQLGADALSVVTKGNPLLGINRSRVSKLRVREPNGRLLFREFVIDATTLGMPLAVQLNIGDSAETTQDEWLMRWAPA